MENDIKAENPQSYGLVYRPPGGGEEYRINYPENYTLRFQFNDKTILEISDKNGIKFNREAFPDFTPDDFAVAVIDILEKGYDLEFRRKGCT
jgi:hypothetical protein